MASFAAFVGKVLEFDPPNRYSHTFKFTAHDDPPCTVTYDLKEVDGGVEFSLTTTNVPVGTKTEKGMAQGGKFIVETFKSVVENGAAFLWWSIDAWIHGAVWAVHPQSV